MKNSLLILLAFLSTPAFAEVDHSAMKSVPTKEISGGTYQGKLGVGQVAVSLYQAEMAKPDSPLAQAIQKLQDGTLNVSIPDPSDVIFVSGSGGHSSDGTEAYTAEFLLPVYYGYKSTTAPLTYLKIFTVCDFSDNALVYIVSLVDINETATR